MFAKIWFSSSFKLYCDLTFFNLNSDTSQEENFLVVEIQF